MFKRWWLHNAEWWQFWYPQSGGPGALIIALLFLVGNAALWLSR